jgi:WD40 repeat protein/Flp pilus assembly protein TadD
MPARDPVARSSLSQENPWPGPDYFETGDYLYFHGREDEKADLVRHLNRDVLTVLVGRSGVGKSSLVRAGLKEPAEASRLVPVYFRLVYAKGPDRAIDQIRNELNRVIEARDLDADPLKPGETLWEYFHRDGAGWFTRDQVLVFPLLVFDQFEELFAIDRSNEAARREADEVWTELADLVENRRPESVRSKRLPSEFPVERDLFKVLLCLRHDYVADLTARRRQMPSALQNNLVLHPFDGNKALAAVLGPGGHRLDGDSEHRKAIAKEIVRRVWREAQPPKAISTPSPEEPPSPAAVELPLEHLRIEPALLSLFCQQLNEACKRPREQSQAADKITIELLKVQGGRIFERFYQGSFEDPEVGPHAEAVQNFIEHKLIGRTAQGVDQRDSVALALVPEDIRPAVNHLVNHRRLLRITGDEGSPRVELIHDRLLPVVRANFDERERLRKAEERRQEEARQRQLEEDKKAEQLRAGQTARILYFAIFMTGIAVAVICIASWLGIRERRLAADKKELTKEQAGFRKRLGEFIGQWAASRMEQRDFAAVQFALLVARTNGFQVPEESLLAAFIPPPVAEPFGQIQALPADARQVAFSPDGSLLIVLDRQDQLWLFEGGARSQTNLADHVFRFAVGGSGKGILVFADERGTVGAFDLSARGLRKSILLPPKPEAFSQSQSAPSAPNSVQAGRSGEIQDRSPLVESLKATWVALSEDARQLVVAYGARSVLALATNIDWAKPVTLKPLLGRPMTSEAEEILAEKDFREPPRRAKTAQEITDSVNSAVDWGIIHAAEFWNRGTELLISTEKPGGNFETLRCSLSSFEVQSVRLEKNERAKRTFLPPFEGENERSDEIFLPLAVSADGRWAAAGATRVRNRLHRGEALDDTPQRRLRFLNEEFWTDADDLRSGVTVLTFAPEGEWLAVGFTDGAVELRYRGQRIQRLPAHKSPISALAFTPDGRYLITAGKPFSKLWRLQFERQRVIPGEQDTERLVFSPDGTEILQIGLLGRGEGIRRLDFGGEIKNTDFGSDVTILGYLDDGRIFGVTESAGFAKLQILPDGPVLIDLDSLEDPPGIQSAFGWSNRGDWMAVGNEDGRVWIADTGNPQSQELAIKWPTNAIGKIPRIASSPSGKLLAVSRESGEIAVIQLSGRRQVATLDCPRNSTEHVQFGPREDILAWPDEEDPRRLVVADFAGRKFSSVASDQPVRCIAVHSATRRVAMADERGQVTLFESFIVTNLVEFERRTAYTAGSGFGTNQVQLDLVPVSGDREREVFPEKGVVAIDSFRASILRAGREVDTNLDRHAARPDDVGFTFAGLQADFAPLIDLFRSPETAISTDPLVTRWQEQLALIRKSPSLDEPKSFASRVELAFKAHNIVTATLLTEEILPQLPLASNSVASSVARLVNRTWSALEKNHTSGTKPRPANQFEVMIARATAEGRLLWDDLDWNLSSRLEDPRFDPEFSQADVSSLVERGARLLGGSFPERGIASLRAALGKAPQEEAILKRVAESLVSAAYRLPIARITNEVAAATNSAERSIWLTGLAEARVLTSQYEAEALAHYREAIELNTNNIVAWDGLARALERRDRFAELPERIRCYERLQRVEIQDRIAVTLNKLGRLYSQMGQFRMAETNLASARLAATNSARFIADHAVVLLDLGEKDQAEREFVASISVPHPEDGYAWMRFAYARLAWGETAAAIDQAAKALFVDANQGASLAELKLALNRPDEVIKDLAALELVRNELRRGSILPGTSHLLTGIAQFRLGQLAAASNAWLRAKSGATNSPTNRRVRARALGLLGDFATAKVELGRAADDQNPETMFSHAELSALQMQRGESGAGEQMWLWLARAAAHGGRHWLLLKTSPAFDSVTGDKRFQKLIEALRLPAGQSPHWLEVARFAFWLATSADLNLSEDAKAEFAKLGRDAFRQAEEKGIKDPDRYRAEPDFVPLRSP